jgi:DNA repair protein RecO
VASYRETSALLHVLCDKEGRIALVGRGMRAPRSRRAVPDAFSLVQTTYSLREGASIGNLTGIEVERSYSGLRERIEAYALANFWFEILRVATQAREAPAGLFELTVRFLEVMDSSSRPVAHAIPLFVRLAAELGYAIDLQRCGVCGRASELVHFDVGIGVVVCARCAKPGAEYLPVEGRTLDLMKGSVSVAHKYGFAEALGALAVVERLLNLHLDHSFRSFGFVVESLGVQ